MGFFESLRAEFIDIIEWENQDGNILVHRFERHDNEIKNGAQLIVRPGQRAVFVNEGKIADSFGPGKHRLETKNLPILATLKGWKYGFDSPFKAEVYFINATELLDRKWGTPSPVMMRDADFGAVRLRARGNYSYRVGLTEDMISRFVGSRDEFSVDNIEGQLRTRIISSFSDSLGELKIPALDIVAQYDEISAAMQKKLAGIFEDLGLNLLSFTLENVSVPEAVQKALDERASMGAVGDLNNYAKFQAANAMRDAAANDSGMAGGMMGMMVGGQLGGAMGGALQQNTPAPAPTVTCPKCGQAVAQGAKFCSNCGADMTPPAVACPKCGKPVAPGAKFCGECGAPLKASCVKCGAELTPGTKFCPACGAPQ
jgi:membrane protease subunit (stomatin/prohibitin family)